MLNAEDVAAVADDFLADCTNDRAYATMLHPSVAVCRRL